MTTTALIRAPGADAIRSAYDAARQARDIAVSAQDTAIRLALMCGQLAWEQREAMKLAAGKGWHGDSGFQTWLRNACPDVSIRTLYRWMDASERVREQAKLPSVIDVEAEAVPLSAALADEHCSTAVADGRTARQLWLEFTADRSLSEILRGVVVAETKEPKAITLGYVGAHAVGSGHNPAVDRTDAPTYIARALDAILGHLSRKLSESRKARICGSLGLFLQHAPRFVLEEVERVARAELKLSDTERAARHTAE